MTRTCTKCGEIKKESDFFNRNSKYKRTWCKFCEYQYLKQRRQIYRKILNELKINGCSICGCNGNKQLLVFHHVEPKDKSFKICNQNMGKPINDLVDEIHKCILLCDHCHKSIHAKIRWEDYRNRFEE